jgi:magnesium-transporting ATPase (P-type)
MNFKRNIISFVFNVICAVGATLVLVGLILSCWFFFASEQENKLYWGGLSLVVACVGYIIYLYIFPKTHKKWTDHY